MTREEIEAIAEEVGCGSYPSSNGIFQPPLNLQKFADRMHAAGKREAVQRVMDVWVDSNSDEFSAWLREYLEELK